MSSINSRLKPLLAGKGFRLKSGVDGGFFKAIPGGYQYIGASIVDYSGSSKVSLVVGIRLDAVENLANKFNLALPRYHSLTRTFNAGLGRFLQNGQEGTFVIVDEQDISAAFTELESIVCARVLPFLEATQDIHSVASAMNLLEIPKVLPGAPNMSAIAIAWLVKHPEFEKIAATYQSRSSNFRKSTQDNLQKFIDYLRQLQD